MLALYCITSFAIGGMFGVTLMALFAAGKSQSAPPLVRPLDCLTNPELFELLATPDALPVAPKEGGRNA